MEQELCPICIEKSAEYFTECNHSFCIECLCKVKKCAMCRKPLQRNQLFIEIKQKIKLINNTSIDNTTNRDDVYSWVLHPDEDQPEETIPWNRHDNVIVIPLYNSHHILRFMAGMPGLSYSN